jgi:mRNA interferase HigB
MIIANYGLIVKFARKHARSRSSLNIWYETTSKSNWNSFDDVKKTLNTSDIYQDCVIFDIAGNNFRLIAHIDYELQQVSVRAILTHAEYDKEKWKKHC